jgi:hypothetical protein
LTGVVSGAGVVSCAKKSRSSKLGGSV